MHLEHEACTDAVAGLLRQPKLPPITNIIQISLNLQERLQLEITENNEDNMH